MSATKSTQEKKQFPPEVISLFEQDANVWYKKVNKTIAEKIAEYILQDGTFGIYWLFSIGKITRWKAKGKPRDDKNMRLYSVDHEDTQNNNKTDIETHICKDLVATSRCKGKTYDHVGTCIDYQTPIRNTRKDKGYNGIDLISYDEKSDTLFFLEAKGPNSREPLLRAALEVFTYWKVADHEKLLYDFKVHMPELSIDPFKTRIKKAVLLFEDSPIYQEYVNHKSPNTIALMKELDVGFYGIRKAGDEYEIFVP